MPTVPENHVSAEGRTLRAALEAAAQQLGVPVALVDHKIDLAHFRSSSGASAGADTVKIFAWSKDPGDLAPISDAEEWMKGLLAAMERTGSVRADLRSGSVVVHVDVGEAGRHLVGRQGTTLRAVQYLMEQTIGGKHPDKSFRIDVARADDDRGGDRDRGDRDRGDRDDRGPRRDDRGDRSAFSRDRGDRGPRRDDRGPRRDDRGDRGPRRDDRGDRGDRPRRDDDDVEGLKRLARKIAAIVVDRGEPEVIRRELNSFDRRIVHLEVAEIPGVASRSVGEGHDRRIEIYPSEGGEGGGGDGGEE